MALLSCDPGQLTRMKKLEIYSLIGHFHVRVCASCGRWAVKCFDRNGGLARRKGDLKTKDSIMGDGLMVCEGSAGWL